MKIPKVHPGIFNSIIVEMDGPQSDPNWTNNMFTRLQIDNPNMAEYLLKVKEMWGARSALTGLVIYRIIESQMEADELTELFSEEG